MRTNLKKSSMPFPVVDYKEKIKKELGECREINAFLLAHGFIEAYLREWLFISGNNSKEMLNKKVIDETARISFKNVILIHTILGNINHELYGKLCRINDLRNDIVHELISIDVENEKNKNKIKSTTEKTVSLIDEILRLSKKKVDTKAENIIEQQKVKFSSIKQ